MDKSLLNIIEVSKGKLQLPVFAKKKRAAVHERPQRTDPLMLFSLLYKAQQKTTAIFFTSTGKSYELLASIKNSTDITQMFVTVSHHTKVLYNTFLNVFSRTNSQEKNSDNNSYTITMYLGFPGGSQW